ncbi:hypothetical protein Tco_0967385 [Tanacetum coccineum]
MPRILIPLRPILGVLQIGIKSQGYREPDTIMSDSEHSAVTYTSASENDLYMGSPGVEKATPFTYSTLPFVPEPVYPEFLPVDDEVFPAEEQPLPAADSPTHQSPGYIPESDPEEDLEEDDEEDPEEDPADYPADRGDDDDDALALAEPGSCMPYFSWDRTHTLLFASAARMFHPIPCAGHLPRRGRYLLHHYLLPPTNTHYALHMLRDPLGIPSCWDQTERCTTLIHETEIPEMWLPLRKRLCRTTPGPRCEVGESSAAGAARQFGPTTAEADLLSDLLIKDEIIYSHLMFYSGMTGDLLKLDVKGSFEGMYCGLGHAQQYEIVEFEGSRPRRQSVITDAALKTDFRTAEGKPEEAVVIVGSKQFLDGVMKWQPREGHKNLEVRPVTATPPPAPQLHHRSQNPIPTHSRHQLLQLQAMIDEGVTAVLAARATTRNGDDSHTSGTGARRNECSVRECTYQDFMKCQPVFFRGTEEGEST